MKESKNQSKSSLLKQFAKGKENVSTSATSVQSCVIYTRVSSKEQADTNQSLEWQKKYCDEYARKNNFNVAGYFGGTYESAKSDERKEFSRMLKYVRTCKQKVRYILVYSLDRFSRTGDSAIYIAGELKKTGVNILAVTQPIDTDSHAGVLQQNIHFIFGKYDNDMRRQKTIDGMREKLLRGEWLGNCPTGYSYDKTQGKGQHIIINEKGPLIKQAFEWRALGITYEVIIAKIKALGLKLPPQTLTDIFRNPFYCGLISHNLLKGEMINGNHPALIDQDLFLRTNNLKKTDGYRINKIQENLPLKIFVYDVDSGAPFTGYLVKKKNRYYYKVNKVGVRINRSIHILHTRFKELLDKHTVSKDYIEAFKVQLTRTWDNLTEKHSDYKKSAGIKLNELETDINTIERNHALGKVRIDVFEKISGELYEERNKILQEVEKLNQKISNPKELINFAVKIASNLSFVWESCDYHEKQSFQNMIFPEGLGFDSKIDDYRTSKINPVFAYYPELVRYYNKKESGSFNFDVENSRLVPQTGTNPNLGLKPFKIY